MFQRARGNTDTRIFVVIASEGKRKQRYLTFTLRLPYVYLTFTLRVPRCAQIFNRTFALRVPYAYLMFTLHLPYAYLTLTLRLPYAYLTLTLRLPYVCLTFALGLPYVYLTPYQPQPLSYILSIKSKGEGSLRGGHEKYLSFPIEPFFNFVRLSMKLSMLL